LVRSGLGLGFRVGFWLGLVWGVALLACFLIGLLWSRALHLGSAFFVVRVAAQPVGCSVFVCVWWWWWWWLVGGCLVVGLISSSLIFLSLPRRQNEPPPLARAPLTGLILSFYVS
jgi:hypothetical protein